MFFHCVSTANEVDICCQNEHACSREVQMPPIATKARLYRNRVTVKTSDMLKSLDASIKDRAGDHLLLRITLTACTYTTKNYRGKIFLSLMENIAHI